MIPKIGQVVKINLRALIELRNEYDKDLDILHACGGELWEASKTTLEVRHVSNYYDEYVVMTPNWEVTLDDKGRYAGGNYKEPLFSSVRSNVSPTYCKCDSPNIKNVHMVSGAFLFCQK